MGEGGRGGGGGGTALLPLHLIFVLQKCVISEEFKDSFQLEMKRSIFQGFSNRENDYYSRRVSYTDKVHRSTKWRMDEED